MSIARMSIRGRRDLLAAINDEPVKMSYLDYLKYIKEESVSREILFVRGIWGIVSQQFEVLRLVPPHIIICDKGIM